MANWRLINDKLNEARSIFRRNRKLGEEYYIDLLKIYGDDGNIYFWRGEDYREVKEYDLALQDFHNAERLFPLPQYKKKGHDAWLEVKDILALIQKNSPKKKTTRDPIAIICQAFPNPPMPEDPLPEGAVRDSAEYRLFLTLTVAIDYLRNAKDLWDLARKTFENPKSRSLFNPREVNRRGQSEVRGDLRVSGLLIGQDEERDGKDLHTWTTLSQTFLEHFGGDPLNLFLAHGMDATAVLNHMRMDGRLFPYLKGEKIGPLWIRMMRDNAQLSLKNLGPVPIPVDVHIERVTQCIVRGASTESELLDRQQVAAFWREAVKDQVIDEGGKTRPMVSLDLDKALWTFGQKFCNSKDLLESCPFSPQCGREESGDRKSAYSHRNLERNGDDSSPFSTLRNESFSAPSRKPSETSQLTSPRVLGVLACSWSKIWHRNPNAGPTAARIAYTGSRFLNDVKIVNAYTTRWVILSGKYGFIDPDFVIPEDYDVTFNKSYHTITNPTVSIDYLVHQIRDMNLDTFDRAYLFSSCCGEAYKMQVEKAFDNFPVRIDLFSQGGS